MTAGTRLAELSGQAGSSAGAQLIAIKIAGTTAGEMLVSRSGLPSGSAGQHLLATGTGTGAATVTLSGVQGAVQVGLVNPGGSSTVGGVGVQGAGNPGVSTATGTASFALAGVQGDAQPGVVAFAGDATTLLAGTQGAIQVGTSTAVGTGTVLAAAAAGTGAAGTAVARGSALCAATGVQGAGGVGTAVVGAAVVPALGVSVAMAVGTVSTTATATARPAGVLGRSQAGYVFIIGMFQPGADRVVVIAWDDRTARTEHDPRTTPIAPVLRGYYCMPHAVETVSPEVRGAAQVADARVLTVPPDLRRVDYAPPERIAIPADDRVVAVSGGSRSTYVAIDPRTLLAEFV